MGLVLLIKVLIILLLEVVLAMLIVNAGVVKPLHSSSTAGDEVEGPDAPPPLDSWLVFRKQI